MASPGSFPHEWHRDRIDARHRRTRTNFRLWITPPPQPVAGYPSGSIHGNHHATHTTPTVTTRANSSISMTNNTPINRLLANTPKPDLDHHIAAPQDAC